ncbi:U2 snRNA/tRNA pseudouridine synthase, putative [Plasmodium relictum]|uniref:U2 snRNA/tRNA pseudouridine synthase, putative n=1 Tax=Plasmodium relictum TaxID=85471 RepID=A0A1J1H709_PLARL|nr:U2 snRNA/tRNA pseudouridine synthase, putative [Plasmodium relictum]CRG99213.1 U2 snRNA/tRNA pseudouridine synthase, putative [Plasmodium relictum]
MYSIDNYGIDYLIRKNINQIEGINGKIKALYEDFHVHEITKNDEILYLNDLIDKNRINKILEENEKNEERNILENISNTDLNLNLISKYINEFNQNIFRQFLQMLYEIYQLKNKKDPDDIINNSKDITIPYCFLTDVDNVTKDENFSQNEFYDKGELHDVVEKKNLRKNIHKVIKQFYPFLITETKNITKIETVISHGNILNDSLLKNKYNVNFDFNNKFGNTTSAIEVYPSLYCLKIILPDYIYKKLKKNSKKYRFCRNDELENINIHQFNDIEKFKNYSKTLERNSEFLNYENSNEKQNEINKTISKIESDNILKKKRKLIDNNLNDEKLLNLKYHSSSNELNIQILNQDETNEKKIYNTYEKSKNFNESYNETFMNDEIINNETNYVDNKLNIRINDKKNKFQGKDTYLYSYNTSHELDNMEAIENNTYLDDLNEIRKKKRELKNKKKYLHFNLYKENKDICEILNKIKINLKKKNSDISYCGIKDKRGITVQKFCIYKIKKEDIFKLIINKSKWCNNVYLSNLEYKNEKLSLGDLKGNFFKILIRGVDNDVQDKCKILSKNLKKYGFVNYYGYQRFGSKKIKNYEIGMCILKKNYKQALSLIIENSELDDESKNTLITYLNTINEENQIKKERDVRKNEKDNKNENEMIYENTKCEAKNNEIFYKNENKIFNNKSKNNHKKKKNNSIKREDSIPEDIERIINSISNKSYVEKKILNSLKNSTNFKNAFMNIPKDIFSLFIHATQSLIFNILANIRMKKYGFQIAIGDLVEINNSEILSSDDSNIDKCSKNKDICKNIVVVTQENILLYDIYDVVLPLPGDQSMMLPINLIDEYNEVLQNFNLSLNDFKSEKNFFNASGCFRKIVVKPYNVKLVFIKNNIDNSNKIPVIKSDLYKLLNEKKESEKERLQEEENDATNKDNEKICENYIKKSDEPAINESNFLNTEKEIEENIIFISNNFYHEHLVKEIPNYQLKSSIFLTCSLPKSSYITVALKEVLNL